MLTVLSLIKYSNDDPNNENKSTTEIVIKSHL